MTKAGRKLEAKQQHSGVPKDLNDSNSQWTVQVLFSPARMYSPLPKPKPNSKL